MAASSNLWCLGVFLILVGLNFVLCIRVSKLHLSYLTPPNSVILKISSLGNSPSLVNQHELFHLTNTGELKLKCDISEFLGKTFILNIENSANDLDQHHVHVTVYNSSKLFSFSQHQYFAIIKENSPRHTKLDILGDLFVNCDKDVSLKFVSGNDGKFYSKHYLYGANQSVEIFTNGPLDREFKDAYILVLQAKSLSGKIAQTIIHVHIQDENDEIPKFNQTKYTSSIVADLPIGSKVLQVSATDKDIGTISYHLEGTKYFGIGSESGILYLTDNLLSKGKNHIFKVIATDQGGLHSASKIQISVISTELKFVSHQDHHLSKRAVNRIEKSFEANENQSNSKPVFSISSQSISPTGIEQYRLIQSSVDLFQVDTRGNIFVKQGHKLDYEDQEHRSITMSFNITNTNSPTGEN